MKYIVLTRDVSGVPFATKGSIHEIEPEKRHGAASFRVNGGRCITYNYEIRNTLEKAHKFAEQLKGAK